jgi:hypothetical protein
MPQTLPEIRKSTSDPVLGTLIESLYLEEGLLQRLPIRGIDGLTFPYTVEKALPGVAFRKINEAFAESVGIVQRPVETLKPFGGDSDTDIVIAKAMPTERGRRDRMFLKAMGVKWVQAFFYSNSPASRAGAAYDDIDGFDGVMKRLADAGTTQVVDMGASSGSDASSVFAIRFGEGWVEGLMQTPAPFINFRNLGEVQTKPVMRSRIDAAAGLAIYHGRALAWLKDITVAVPLTVDKLDDMINLVPGRPNALFMTKRSRTQLQKNMRTLGLTFGRSLSEIGDVVETYGEIPIVISDAMIDTETAS